VSLPILPRTNQEEPPQKELAPEYQDAEQRVSDTGDTIEGQCVFSKNTPYIVTVASCLDDQAKICGAWGDQWKFSTGNRTQEGLEYRLNPPQPIGPEYDPAKPLPVVNKSTSLRWKADNCTSFIQLFVAPVGGSLLIDKDKRNIPSWESVVLSENNLSKLWDEPSDLDKEYVWNVQPCWRIKDDIRCEPGVFSEEWHFKTIGEPPLLKTPENKEIIKIPGALLSWQNRDGAKFYKIQVASDENFNASLVENRVVQNTSFAVALKDGFRPNEQYWWRISVCTDQNGEVCGNNWSEKRTFHTYPLFPPGNPDPEDGEETFLPKSLSWEPDPGASYYQYQISYTEIAQDETLEECGEKLKQQQFFQPPYPITQSTSFFLNEKCTGTYNWAVRSCTDETCDETKTPPTASSWSSLWTFTAKEIPTEERFGLVPCGRNSNNDATPYNEKEACGLKHVGFLLQNILDFVLWKLSLIILAALAAFVAASAYFSFVSPDVITSIRSVLRSYFYGVLYLVFAWAIVNITMAVFGFNIEFFGRWYEIPF